MRLEPIFPPVHAAIDALLCAHGVGRKHGYDSTVRFELSQQAQARLGQQMKLAPRVLQSMEILQMPLASIEERIESELESNVALEQVEPEQSDGVGSDEGSSVDGDFSQSSTASETAPPTVDRFARAEDLHERTGDDDASEIWREIARKEGDFDPRAAALENAQSSGQSFEEVLLDQWLLYEAPAPIMEAGRVLIANIGENGFLVRPLADIASECAQLDANAPTVALLGEALKRLQSHLEPAGLAARDFAESLILQLDARRHNNPPPAGDTRFADARVLVESDLRDLESNRLVAIRQRHGWTEERLEQARECLRHCDPAPGRTLRVESAPIVRPDVIVEYDSISDSYTARLASGVLPNLRVSEEYLRLSKAKSTDAAAKTMLVDGIRRARWFIDAIEQRGATLLRVMNEVIARQREWLDAGGGALKPLPMTQVARELRMNVSTISRAVAGKWIATPRGVFELRRLFTGGTETESGADISWIAVKALVREIIAAEDKSKPLSDQAISLALKERGIPLARRTVVKYREQLSIATARGRRLRQSR